MSHELRIRLVILVLVVVLVRVGAFRGQGLTTSPDAYPRYRRSTRMLLPFLR